MQAEFSKTLLSDHVLILTDLNNHFCPYSLIVLGSATDTQCPTLSKFVTRGNNSVAMNDCQHTSQHKSIWKMKTHETKIQSGKWQNAYKIIGPYLLVLHYCISTDLTKAY